MPKFGAAYALGQKMRKEAVDRRAKATFKKIAK
jgi:hypothetical protein